METIVQPAPRKRRNTTLKIIGAVVAAGILGLCALLVVGFLGFRAGAAANRSAGPAASRFLTLIERHQYAAAHNLMTPAAQLAAPVSKLQDLQQFMEKEHGRSLGHSGPTNWYLGYVNGVTTDRLSYTERFARGPVSVIVTLARDGSSWRVQGLRYPQM